MSRVIVGLLVALAAVLSFEGEARAERRVALVVGNATYAHTSSLRNPYNDGQDVADMLRNLGFEVLVGLDLDQASFARKIEEFARALDDADVALFFYAGHGLQVNEKNYLVSVNAKLESEFLVASETIELDAVLRLMETKAALNLVFLDACRNNPLAENLRRSLVSTKRAALLGRGLARVETSGRNTLVAFATAPSQEAADGEGRNSPFTGALLKHMPRPGLEVSVMLKEVAADVRRETRNAQRPQQLSDMMRAFYFASADPAPAPALPSALPAAGVRVEDRSVEIAYWNSVLAANNCDAVRAYLNQYPRGSFTPLARLAEKRLCEPARPAAVAAASDAPAPAPAPPPPPKPAAVLAAVPPPAEGPPAADEAQEKAELARNAQLELLRVGCLTGVTDSTWGSTARAGLQRFNRHAGAKLPADAPTRDLIAALREHRGRVCPVTCEKGHHAEGERCVADAPPPSNKAKRSVSRHKQDDDEDEPPQKSRRKAAKPPEPPARRRQETHEHREPREYRDYREEPRQHTPRQGAISTLCQTPIMMNGRRCCTYDTDRGAPRVICP